MLVDQARITVKAGAGGSGIISFRREKYVPKGGPDGGDGGKGGDIILKVNPNLHTLLDFRFRQHYKATSGRHGQGARKTGRSGKDLIIPLPKGTIVRNALTGEMLADLVEEGQEVLIAKGGRGGRGNACFATPTNRAPRYYEPGDVREKLVLELELKLIADVGIIGLPNAGKSTLLSHLSRARPKIADYPFTTLEPHLGIVYVEPYKSFVMADLPGLIAGAHEGKGLGIQFLKHIERTRVLLLLIDSSQPEPEKAHKTVLNELEQFNPTLLTKKRISVLSKVDLLPADAKMDSAYEHRISSVTGEGITPLLHYLWAVLQETAHG
ncbi:MAG: GTPase ObgE [bacterium]